MGGYCDVRNKELILSSDAMCHVFGVSRQTLVDWERKGCPKINRGQWALSEVIQWRSGAFERDFEGADRTKVRDVKLRAEAALKTAQAAKAKREMEILEGKYLPQEEIHQEWAGRIVELKAGLMNWIKALPPELANADARNIEIVLRR